jgi:hypothetical protein
MLLLNCSGSGGSGSVAGGGGNQPSQNCDYYCTNFLQEIDSDVDNNVDEAKSYFYAYIAGDRVTGFLEYDNDGDRAADAEIEISYTYDFNNNLLTIVQRRDNDANGTPDDRITTTWSLDGNGRREVGTIETDTGDDTTIDTVTTITYTYNQYGALLSEYIEIDNAPLGSPDSASDRTFTPTHGPGGRIDENIIEYDSDDDGTVDDRRTVTNTYAKGLRLSKVVEIDSDGDVDGNNDIDAQQTSTYSHDTSGNETEEVVIEDNDLDGNLDGQADSTWTNTWTYSQICADTLSEPLNPLDTPI